MMKQPKPFGLSLSNALPMLLLYAALVIDTLTGLNLNLYGYGREPFLFALGAVLLSVWHYASGAVWLGMMTLMLCCAWLVLYPAKNGFDAVLSPTLFVSVVMWFWQTYKTKK
jgi:hypothetical protein